MSRLSLKAKIAILRMGNFCNSNSEFPVCSNRQLRSGIGFNARAWIIFCVTVLLLLTPVTVSAAGIFAPDGPGTVGFAVQVGGDDDPQSVVTTLQVLFILSLISLAPSLLIMLTSFVRIIIVMSFTRQAMATQQMPPSQVLVGLALFLTLFIMAPVFSAVNTYALIPFGAGDIGMEEAIAAGMAPIREFMWMQVSTSEPGLSALELFFNLAGEVMYDFDSIGNHILIPAFIVNEITVGFQMGFFIYLPFIVIDMVVASVLMSMGMMMLPPAMISMPFKIMVFILGGGWQRIIEDTLQTFVI